MKQHRRHGCHRAGDRDISHRGASEPDGPSARSRARRRSGFTPVNRFSTRSPATSGDASESRRLVVRRSLTRTRKEASLFHLALTVSSRRTQRATISWNTAWSVFARRPTARSRNAPSNGCSFLRGAQNVKPGAYPVGRECLRLTARSRRLADRCPRRRPRCRASGGRRGRSSAAARSREGRFQPPGSRLGPRPQSPSPGRAGWTRSKRPVQLELVKSRHSALVEDAERIGLHAIKAEPGSDCARAGSLHRACADCAVD